MSQMRSDDKVLFMLIGPKGSGKTYIGMLVDRHTDIAFLRVEFGLVDCAAWRGWMEKSRGGNRCDVSGTFQSYG